MNIKRADVISKSYNDYAEKCKPGTTKRRSEYRKILKDFFSELAYELITTGDRIALPAGLGCLQAVSYKKKKYEHFSIDYKRTNEVYGDQSHLPKEERKLVRHTNQSTDGMWTRIHWYRSDPNNKYAGRFKYATNYYFKMTRPNLRPNTYNKENPKVSLYPYYREVGWMIYKFKDKA